MDLILQRLVATSSALERISTIVDSPVLKSSFLDTNDFFAIL
jgi:hypothetical protein